MSRFNLQNCRNRGFRILYRGGDTLLSRPRRIKHRALPSVFGRASQDFKRSGFPGLPCRKRFEIALDAMGGDHGPSMVIPGAAFSLTRHPESNSFCSVTPRRSSLCWKIPARESGLAGRTHQRRHPHGRQAKQGAAPRPPEFLHVARDRRREKARGGRRGVRRQYRRVDGDVQIASQNAWPGIDRPAIACQWPTLKGDSIVLDVGASIGADAEHLAHLAAMGSAMARVLLISKSQPWACSISAWKR